MSAFLLTGWENEIDLGIVALASHLEDYQLAYTINQILNTKFKNNINPLSVDKKKHSYQYSVFKSIDTRTTPLMYLIDNLSFQEDLVTTNNSLLDNASFYQIPLIKTLKKWHYIIISEDVLWLKQMVKTKNLHNIIYAHQSDIKTLNKYEQTILHSITYDE